MRMIVEQLVEWRLAGETEVLGEKLPQRHFVHHKSHMTRPGLEPRAEYCDILLTLGTSDSRAGTAAWKYALHWPGCHPEANVFRRMEELLHEIRIVTLTDCKNTSQWRCHNVAVKRESWRCSRNISRELGLSQPRVLEVLHDRQLYPCYY
jgi:hypothetical protein